MKSRIGIANATPKVTLPSEEKIDSTKTPEVVVFSADREDRARDLLNWIGLTRRRGLDIELNASNGRVHRKQMIQDLLYACFLGSICGL
jgi:hypothetical protein